MKKRSKLSEKPSRIPDIREVNLDAIIGDYIKSVKSQPGESARSQLFLLLLKDLFGIQPGFIEEYISGVEKFIKVKQKDHILKGEVDNLFGNLIIEFERDLNKKRDEAEGQLKKYVACLWLQEKPSQRTSYLCIATDGINFNVYSPVTQRWQKDDIQPEEVDLNLIEQIDWTSLRPQEIFLWLDRFFSRKEILSPKSEEIVRDFGIKSHAFQVIFQKLYSLWQELKGQSDFRVIYESWQKYLHIVYGSEVAEDELFCRHTYLATLAKLMVWCRLSEGKFDDNLIIAVLSGHFFKEHGIENFLEEDFFSWIVREKVKNIGIDISRQLLSLLKNYNLSELSEDVLKSLYQELVDPKTRHDLGEFYTPDWLAHRMVLKLVNENPEGSFLDPACGSGTFLYFIIKEKRNYLKDSEKTLRHIQESVVGIDSHPLAVIISKTNYLLALGELLKRRKKINIPVYLADSIKLPEEKKAKDVKIPVWLNDNVYTVEIDGKPIYFSKKLISDPNLYDEAIECIKSYATANVGAKIEKQNFQRFIQVQFPDLPQDDDTIKVLFYATRTLKELIEQNRDTIWAFVLKNIYKPLFLREKFNFVIGNPPWLAFRFAELSYQEFLKEQVTKKYSLLTKRGELITHLELGTYFFIRATDLYLKESGTIAFVLPKSIFSADQHDCLRKGEFKDVNLKFKEVWDLEEVSPLFNVPACVLIAEKKKTEKVVSISGEKLSGNLTRKNASLDESEEKLSKQNVEFFLHKQGKRSYWSTEEVKGEVKESYYKKYFYQGATIVPRSFWFVEIKPSSLGINPDCPPVETSSEIKPGPVDTYRDVKIEGNIEKEFLYYTILGDDIIPFGCRKIRPIILPVKPMGNYYKLFDANEARKRGFCNLTQWLEKAEREWQKRRKIKGEVMSIYERLDRYRGVSQQSTLTQYRVLYPNFQRIMTANVLKVGEKYIDINGQAIRLNNFIAESALYYFETNNEEEAFYLCSFINSSITDIKIQNFRRRQQKLHPNIHKKIFDVVSIPKFNPADSNHLRLAILGKECTEKVARWVKAGEFKAVKSIGRLRQMVRDMLKRELAEIDAVVQKILQE